MKPSSSYVHDQAYALTTFHSAINGHNYHHLEIEDKEKEVGRKQRRPSARASNVIFGNLFPLNPLNPSFTSHLLHIANLKI